MTATTVMKNYETLISKVDCIDLVTDFDAILTSRQTHEKLQCLYENLMSNNRVQRKSVLQPAIRASCSQYVLAHESFQLAPKLFLISRIDYNPSIIWISPKNSTCPSGKLRPKITSPIAKSTSHGLSDTTFFARWIISKKRVFWKNMICKLKFHS